MLKRCCCGKYMLEGGEPFIHNTTRHEALGEDRFCGPDLHHRLRDMEKRAEAAEKKIKENIRELERLKALMEGDKC